VDKQSYLIPVPSLADVPQVKGIIILRNRYTNFFAFYLNKIIQIQES